jgi:ADP-ribose pyrophosphatase
MIIYKGRVFAVEVDRKPFPDGSEHEVTIVRHPPSVVLVPVQEDGRVVLIRQYRPSVDAELWELPAGSLHSDESPEAAAIRECVEETGLMPGRLERLGAWFPAPGFCDEQLIFFRASELGEPPPDSRYRPDEDEVIEVRAYTLEEARGLVRRGEIVDLKTAYGLTLL